MSDTHTFAPFFSLPAKPKRRARPYVATWPCGATWTIEGARGDWSAPIYSDGRQTGVSIECDTRAELIAELRAEGATVARQ
jgi:hypothetical protein